MSSIEAENAVNSDRCRDATY